MKIIFNLRFFACVLCLLLSIITSYSSIAQGFTTTTPSLTTTNTLTTYAPFNVNADGTGANPIYIGRGANQNFTNIGIGFDALFSTTASATSNVAFGRAAMKNLTSGVNNTGIGTNALLYQTIGSYNTSVGAFTLYGVSGGSNNTGGYNTAIGNEAMRLNENGINNVGVGSFALYTNSSGSSNVAIGRSALYANQTTANNTALGGSSLTVLTSSDPTYTANNGNNSAVGTASLGALLSGSENVAMGYQSLNTLLYGSNTVGIGARVTSPGGVGSSGSYSRNYLTIQNVIYGINMTGVTTAGTGNIGISVIPSGTATGIVSAGTLSKLHIGGSSGTGMPSLQLDYVPTVTNPGTSYLYVDPATGVVGQATLPGSTGINACSNVGNIPIVTNTGGSGNMGCSDIYSNGTTVAIGVGSAATYTWTSGGTGAGQYGNSGTDFPPTLPTTNYKLYVAGWTGATGYIALSDQRLKKNIKQIENPLSKIARISGYTYNWDLEAKSGRNLDNSRQSGFMAQEIAKVLPEAVVKSSDGYLGINYNGILPLLTEGIKAQQEQINSQNLEIAELKDKLTELSNKVNQLRNDGTLITKELFTISPNPVTNHSIVAYEIPKELSRVYFVVYDLQGKVLKQFNLSTNSTSGVLHIKKSDFANGMYIISLISNNEEIQTKKFLIN